MPPKKSIQKVEIFSMFFIAAAALIWGLDGVLLRPSLYSLPAKVVVFYEHFLAFLVMGVIVLGVLIFKGGNKPKWLTADLDSIKNLTKKGWFVIGWIALFGGLIGTLAITKALFFVGYIPISIPILIQKTQPIIAVIFARFMLKEKLSKQFLIWFVLALIGSYLVTFGFEAPVLDLKNKTLLAGILGFVAAFAWGSSTVFGRLVAKDFLTFRSAVFLRLGLTTVFTLILVLISGDFGNLFTVSSASFNILIYVVLFNALLATFLYYKGLKKTPAKIATIAELIFPLTMIVGDYFLNGKILTIPQFLGAFLILISVVNVRR
jgi:drug/metabolite transporter (DMT)-like permease